MPIKYNLTNYDVLAGKIKKVALKGAMHANGGAPPKQPEVESADDAMLKNMAVLIAAFSSGHSWQTHKSIVDREALNKPEIKSEFGDALSSRWKDVSQGDIFELATKKVSDTSFFQWLFFNVDRDKHEDYKLAWQNLSKELAENCDEITESSKT
jgi:hypothetical protein